MERRLLKTSKDLQTIIWDKVLEEFAKAKSTKEVERLFHKLVTVQEREVIARRLAVLSLVRKGVGYREIGEKLWVSPVTISAIKKSILGGSGYQSYHATKKGYVKENRFKNDPDLIPESAFSQWLDYIAFMIENAPQISGPRWRFLNYPHTAPKKYRQRYRRRLGP